MSRDRRVAGVHLGIRAGGLGFRLGLWCWNHPKHQNHLKTLHSYGLLA